MNSSFGIRRNHRFILIIALLMTFANHLTGQGKFMFELLPGGAITLPSSLTIDQQGFPEIKFTAHYRHDNLILPIYYSGRIAYAINNKWGCELELNHLKIILVNNPVEIEEFSVTHGYNQLWLNGTRTSKGFVYRAGIGGVLAHPENTIRGKIYYQKMGLLNHGYHLCGITSQLAVQKRYFFCNHFFISGEVKLNVAYAKIPIADGFAHTPVYAFHALAGVGVRF